MKLGVLVDPGRPWDDILAIVQWLDTAGFESVYLPDHFMPHTTDDLPTDGPTIECLAALAALAARTARVRIGSMVLGNLYRHPAVVANAACTIDVVSDGRFVLGLGAGWQRNEHTAYGIDLLGTAARMDRFEEACEVVRLLTTQSRTRFAGEHYRIVDAPCDPRPVRGSIPLLVGGGGERRTLRTAARWADEWNAWTTPEQFRHKREVLDRHCADVGRDPAAIRTSTQALTYVTADGSGLDHVRDADLGRPALVGSPAEVAEQLGEYATVGVDEFVVTLATLGDRTQALETLDLFRSEVIPVLG